MADSHFLTTPLFQMTIPTPRHAMIHGHFVADVVNFNNERVKVNSLDKHPTEGNHEEVLRKSCYCYTGALQKKGLIVTLRGLLQTLIKSLD